MPYGITQCYLPPDRGENPDDEQTSEEARTNDVSLTPVNERRESDC